tara:strand:+ start:119 stop:361 length:243 start_codon:yes stop_codon:yes gene_type:complete
MTSKESIFTSHLDQKKTSLELQEKGDKLGRKVAWDTIRTQYFLMQKSLENLSNNVQEDARRKSEIDHGRLVHGIRNALAT